ncbi:MAG TPA: DUF5995 family protein [Chloroflexia bacterium]|nr:DUF5995 family protein [Chloroflexia bacterium]
MGYERVTRAARRVRPAGAAGDPGPSALPPCAPVPTATSIAEVVTAMTNRWQALQRAHDWRAVFAKTYLRTTERILAATRRPGLFENPAWMVELDCNFAGRYFAAIDCWEAGGACPRPWVCAFAGAQTKRTLVLQDMLLGMNAHINYDLPYALDATIPAGLSRAALAPYLRDHLRMNRLLARTIGAVQRAAGLYDPLLPVGNLLLGAGIAEGTAQLIEIWRERSWAHFLLLRSDVDRAEADRLIEGTAHEYGLLLLQLQRVVPGIYWPNRLYRDTIGWLRAWF